MLDKKNSIPSPLITNTALFLKSFKSLWKFPKKVRKENNNNNIHVTTIKVILRNKQINIIKKTNNAIEIEKFST